jgi:hypothetical protein
MSELIPIFIVVFVGAIGIALGIWGMNDNSYHSKYKQCRYYNQTIERCVTELGWEKK